MKRYVYLVCHLQTIIKITIEYEYNKINEIKQTSNKKQIWRMKKKRNFAMHAIIWWLSTFWEWLKIMNSGWNGMKFCIIHIIPETKLWSNL